VPCKRVIAGCGVGGTYTLPGQREVYTDDFGGETDALGHEILSLGRKILKVLIHSVVRPDVTAQCLDGAYCSLIQY
jgi:hypothetical protein